MRFWPVSELAFLLTPSACNTMLATLLLLLLCQCCSVLVLGLTSTRIATTTTTTRGRIASTRPPSRSQLTHPFATCLLGGGGTKSGKVQRHGHRTGPLYGILDDFFSVQAKAPKPASSAAPRRRTTSTSTSFSDLYDDRQKEFPEQYPATYDLLTSSPVWWEVGDARFVRPLLKNTQLASRPLQVVYDASWQGWNAKAFHKAVDGKGAAVVLCRSKGQWFGGYNPKGWSGLGGARPSVASFLFYRNSKNRWQKLQKVGGGGLACAKDDANTGIWLGADGLVVPLSSGGGGGSGGRQQSRLVDSRLGTYFERGPEGRYSIVPDNAYLLEDLKVLVGVYASGEEIPYSGAVLDFTSG